MIPVANLKPVTLSSPHHHTHTHTPNQTRAEQTRQLPLTCPRCAARPLCAALTVTEMSSGIEGVRKEFCLILFLPITFTRLPPDSHFYYQRCRCCFHLVSLFHHGRHVPGTTTEGVLSSGCLCNCVGITTVQDAFHRCVIEI